MRRILIAAAALLAMQHEADGATKKIAHRLSPMPGFSLTLPDGWMACDAASNRALGNAPRVIVMEKLCARMEAKTNFDTYQTKMLVDSDPSAPLMLLAGHTSAFTLPDEYFTNATPQLLDEVDQNFCAEIRKTMIELSDCAFHAGEIGGRPAYVADAQGSGAPGQKAVARLYIVSASVGTIFFAFATSAPALPKAQAEMDVIERSIKITPPQPPAAAEPVSLTPLPGITMAVPKSWMACDDQNNALLGGKTDAAQVKPQICAETVPGHIVRMFDPRPPYFESVEIASIAAQPDPDAIAKRLQPDQIAKDRDQHCTTLSSPFVSKGFALNSCEAEGGTVGGHPAQIVTMFVQSHPEPGKFTVNAQVRAITVLVGGQVYAMTLTTGSALQPKFDAAADAIVGSVTFQ